MLFALVLIVAGALVMCAVPAFADDFVRISSDQFTVDGTVYKIKGANYYPASAPWADMFGKWNWNEMCQDIEMLRSLGINSVRINLPYSAGGWNGPNVPTDYLDKLERLVELLRSKGMRANITLFDWETSFPSAGTAKEAEHRQYIAKIVNRLKNNPGVFLWDVKNEPDHPDNIGGHDNWDNSPANRDKIVSWLNRMCQYIRTLDSNHPVSAGIRWYDNVSDVIGFVDVAIFHSYWPNIGTVAIPTAKAACGASPKPVLIQEFGWPSQPHPCWRDQWIYDYTETRQVEVFKMNLDAFTLHDIAGGIMWQACDLKPYVSDPNTDKSASFENYFGLWRLGYNIKPAAIYYRDHWPAAFFPYSDTTNPAPPTGVSASGEDRAISITWTHSASPDCAGAIVRCGTSSYPAGPNDGTLVANVTGESKTGGSFKHMNLQRDTTYYYSVFAYDYAGNYSSRVTVSARTLYQPGNLFGSSGVLDGFIDGVGAGWTAYERYPGGSSGPITFNSDASVSSSGGASQAITNFGSAVLPSDLGGYAHAGIMQSVPAVPGRHYVMVADEKMTASSALPLYFRTFGIDPTGSTDPGAPGAANVAGARWMGPDSLFWNCDVGGSNTGYGMYRCISSATASSSSISCWAGIGIKLADGRATSDKINYDSLYLHEFDSNVNQTPLNTGFEGGVVDCIDADLHFADGWLPVGGGYGKFLGWQVSTSVGVPRSGSKCASFICYSGRSELGLMQRVAVFPGETLSASVYVRGVATGTPTTSASIGIDPTGGTDIFADTVEWGTLLVGNNAVWSPVSVNTTALSSAATIFIKASSGTTAAGYHTVYADDLSFSAKMNASSPSQLKSLPDGRPAALTGCIVTAKFDGFFYVEDAARTSGIRVVSSAAVSPGQVVNVSGTMGTTNGERCLISAQ